MKYAVIQTGGKQYKVSEGDILDVERLEGEKEQKVTFPEVLLYTNEGSVSVGTPFVQGISVECVIMDHVKGDKIRVAKFKAKSRYRRTTGHRQSLTKIKIETINDGKKAKTAEITQKKEESAKNTDVKKESSAPAKAKK